MFVASIRLTRSTWTRLKTKEEIVRAFWELTYVPSEVYETAVGGAHVLRAVTAGDVGDESGSG